MSKSIIIFGKGPSVLKCNKEYVNSFDDIALCNYPVLNDFFYNLISNRKITYHFANCGSFDKRYTNKVNKILNIQYIINTNKPTNNYKNYLNNENQIFITSIVDGCKNYLKKLNIKLDPSTGTQALIYILNSKLYNKIALVGFDNFKVNDNVYYYKKEEFNPELLYLFDNGTYNNNTIIKKSGHDSNITQKYYEYEFENNKNISFELITSMKLNKIFENVKLL
tara:strand:+ start:316 stop:984 length:669 start_codon:yes stop_codon:yes gene_type:complete